MLVSNRTKFATIILKECNKNPEATNCFISAVAETVNIADLQTISIAFDQVLEENKKHQERNQNN